MDTGYIEIPDLDNILPAEQKPAGIATRAARPGSAGQFYEVDHRNSPRYLLHWKIALVFDGQEGKPTFHGRTQDVSLHGAAMLTRHNIYTEAPVTVLLAPPPLHQGRNQRVIEIHARQSYAVYSGEAACFRIGLEFIKYKGKGLEMFKQRLTHHDSAIYGGGGHTRW